MKFRPLHDRVVVKRIEEEQKTKGGIIIPDTAKEKPQEGEVVAVGPGARDDSGKLVELTVEAGDRTYRLDLEDRDGSTRRYGEDEVQLTVDGNEARLRIEGGSDYSDCRET